MIELSPRLRAVLAQAQPNMESVKEVDAGILVVPSRRLSARERLNLHVQLTTANDLRLVAHDSYLIAKETLVDYHLAKLKVVFQTSHAEIRESMMFLMAAGVSVDRIQNETGASHATIYRYAKKTGKISVT